ncbi:carbamoyl-phosphate synthase small chain, partial [Arthrobacter sp. Hiyo6]
MEGARLAEEVSVDEAYTVEPKDHGWEGEPRFSIAAIDLGIKRMTPVASPSAAYAFMSCRPPPHWRMSGP